MIRLNQLHKGQYFTLRDLIDGEKRISQYMVIGLAHPTNPRFRATVLLAVRQTREDGSIRYAWEGCTPCWTDQLTPIQEEDVHGA